MIKQINIDDLPTCLELIHDSFITVAKEYGLTEQNCPANPAYITYERLKYDFENGALMYGYVADDEIIGFVRIIKKDEYTFELGRLAVLPEYRHNKIGSNLINFVKDKVCELGGKKIIIGIIEENTRLKNWYIQNGFIHTGTLTLAHLPFVVGYLGMLLKAESDR